MSKLSGGWGGIRTPGGVATSAVFKTVAFDRSATHPKLFLPPVFQTCGFVRLSHLAVLLTTPLRSASRDMFALLTRTQDRAIARYATHPNFFLPLVFQTCDCAMCIIAYFFLNANAKINSPAKNNIIDNNCPIVRPHEVKKPI